MWNNENSLKLKLIQQRQELSSRLDSDTVTLQELLEMSGGKACDFQ